MSARHGVRDARAGRYRPPTPGAPIRSRSAALLAAKAHYAAGYGDMAASAVPITDGSTSVPSPPYCPNDSPMSPVPTTSGIAAMHNLLFVCHSGFQRTTGSAAQVVHGDTGGVQPGRRSRQPHLRRRRHPLPFRSRVRLGADGQYRHQHRRGQSAHAVQPDRRRLAGKIVCFLRWGPGAVRPETETLTRRPARVQNRRTSPTSCRTT